MNRITGDTWLIRDRDKAYDTHCAKLVFDFAESEAAKDGQSWYFDRCYANWKEKRHTFFFKSYQTPEYSKAELAIEATQQADDSWQLRITGKTLK